MSTAFDRSRRLVARVRRRLASLGRRASEAATLDVAALDLDDAAIARDPLPHYEALRAVGTVHFLQRHRAWIVLGHDEVQGAFKRPEVFSNQPYADVDAVLLASDPPAHTAVRRTLAPYFARDVIDALGAFAAQRAAALLERACDSSTVPLDVVADYAKPLSQAVAARLLGLDDVAVAALRASAASAGGFHEHLRDIDALGHRAALYERLRSDGFDGATARSLVRLFWIASTATTQRVLAECVLALLERPDVRIELEASATLLPAFIEEVMRLHPPEPMLRRRTWLGVDIGGVHIPAQADVYLCLAAANRDPQRFADPDRLDVRRPDNLPLTFAPGPHLCLGAQLARMELKLLFQELLPRIRSVQLDGPIERLRSNFICGMKRLPVKVQWA
jgi:cytochrome P450